MTSVYYATDFFGSPAWAGSAAPPSPPLFDCLRPQPCADMDLSELGEKLEQGPTFEPECSEPSYSFAASLSPSSTNSSVFSPRQQLVGQQQQQQSFQMLEPQPLLMPCPGYEPVSPDFDAFQQPPQEAPGPFGSASSCQFKAEPCSPSTSEESGQQQAGRRSKSKEDKVCGVCGDRALGFNFDAISCESCKAFFRRNASKGVSAFKCPYEAKCVMDVTNRRFCKRCRLQKCFDIGMKKEYILTDAEKMEKRKKIDQNKTVRILEQLQWLPKDLSAAELAERDLLTEPEIDEIKFLTECYHNSEQVRVPEREGQRATTIVDLINFAELSVVRVIDMAKKLAPFKELTQPDKICLLKGGALDLILLRGVISFDPQRAQFLDSADDEQSDSMQGQDFLKAAGSSAGHAFFQLAKCLRSSLQCDQTTMIVLLVVCLFSPDRPELSPEGRELVEEAQIKYCLLLDKLLKTRLPLREARKVYPQLISQLAELRGLERDFSDLMGRSDPRFVRPLMMEFLDVQEAVTAKQRHQSNH